ncbi:retrovirus-related pol polyprotein from transposon TNT 1-94 [Tanacetum coccineum]
MKETVMPNNSQVMLEKMQVENHHRISSFSNKTKCVTACNDSLKSRTSNTKAVCVTCGKCVFNLNHDACVVKYINDMNAITKKHKLVPINTRKPTKNANQSVATPHKITVASETTIHKSSSYFRMLYEKTGKAWTWWIEKQCASGYIWKLKVKNENAFSSNSLPLDDKSRFTTNSKPFNKMGSNLSNSLLSSKCFTDRTNHPIHRRLWMHKAHDRKPQVAVDADLEVAFQKSTCFVRDLQGNNLLTGNRRSDLYTIAIQESSSPTPICFMAKASPSQAWLWHHRLSHLNCDTINLLSNNDIVNGLLKLKDGENLNKMKEKGDPCIFVGYATQSKGYKEGGSIHINFDEIKDMASDYDNSSPAPKRQIMCDQNNSGLTPQRRMTSDDNTYGLAPQWQKTSIHNSTELRIQYHNNELSSSKLVPNDVPTTDTTNTSLQDLELLLSPMYGEYFNQGNKSVSKSFALFDNLQQKDTQPTLNVQPTSELIIPPTDFSAKEINTDQAKNAPFKAYEFINPFAQTRNRSYHPLEQVPGNPSKPVQTRRKLATDPEMCMFALNPGMDKCDSIGTPMATSSKFDADLNGTPVDQTNYQSMIGSLMFLTSSKPDLGQEYLKDSSFELTTFLDADHAGCLDTRKTTYGGIQFLGDKLVGWVLKKQECTAMSTEKAEYVALSTSCAQVLWMRTQLKDYGFNYNKIPLYYDSQSAITISCNPMRHSHTKHINVRCHFINEQVKNGIIELYFVKPGYQLADMYTNALSKQRFEYLVGRLGMRCLTPAKLEVLTNETA